MERWTPAHHRAPGSRCCPHHIPQSLFRSHRHSPSPLLCEDTGMKEPSTGQCVEGGASLCPPTGHTYANVSSLFPQTQGHVTGDCLWRKTQEQGQPVSSRSLFHVYFSSKKLPAHRAQEPRRRTWSPPLSEGPVQLPSPGELLQAPSQPCRHRAGAMPATGHLET